MSPIKPALTGRIVRSADFERVLGASPRARSQHFAVHHVPGMPSRAVRLPAVDKLSTDGAATVRSLVDEVQGTVLLPPRGVWLGTVVPKRHARRSVTRSLLKRQIKAAWQRQSALPGGLWVVRLRAPFPKDRFPSAACDALARCAREELDLLLAGLMQRVQRQQGT